MDTDTITLTRAGMVYHFIIDKYGEMPPASLARSGLEEELEELLEALRGDAAPSQILKECKDVEYRILGLELVEGWDGDGAFDAVHANNMQKPKATQGMKVQKGDVKPPSMEKYLG